MPVFWSVSTQVLPMRVAAVGIAFINSISVTAGAIAPYAMGLIKMSTGTMAIGLYLISALLLSGALLMVCVIPRNPAIAE